MGTRSGNDVVIEGATASATASSGGIAKITITMPFAIMVRGFVLAVRRYEAAVKAERGPDVHVALFEALAWLDSLDERAKLAGSDEVRAVKFARQRMHHQWALPAFPDQAAGDWRWYPLEILPEGDPKYPSKDGEPVYQRVLAEQPVLATLHRIEAVVRKVAPDADLT